MGREVPEIVNLCIEKPRHFKRKIDGEMYQKKDGGEAAAEAGFRTIFSPGWVRRSLKFLNYVLKCPVHFKIKIDGKMYRKRTVMRQRRRRDFVLFLVPDGSGDPQNP